MWKEKKQRRRGVYVTSIRKPFDFKKHTKKKVKESTSKAWFRLQVSMLNSDFLLRSNFLLGCSHLL